LHHSFVIARSSLDEEDVKKLKDIVFRLKAKLSETWENFCTHLTVAKDTLFTTKVRFYIILYNFVQLLRSNYLGFFKG